jgi:hypothetical protein
MQLCLIIKFFHIQKYRRQLCAKFPNPEISKCGGFISLRMQRTAAAGLMPSSWKPGVTGPFKSHKMKTVHSQQHSIISHMNSMLNKTALEISNLVFLKFFMWCVPQNVPKTEIKWVMLQNGWNVTCLKHSLNTWHTQAVSKSHNTKERRVMRGMTVEEMALQCWHSGSLKGLERVQRQCYYNHQKSSYCCKQSTLPTKTSNHYNLCLKINENCVKNVNCDVLWMHQQTAFCIMHLYQ